MKHDNDEEQDKAKTKEADEKARKEGHDLRPLVEKADPGHQYDAVKAQQAWVAQNDQRRLPRDEEQPERQVGDIVHYTWDDDEVYPAIVMKQHEDGSLDLKILIGYAHGTLDKHHILLSEEGTAGTFMDKGSKEEREEKVKAALDKRHEAEQKASEEIKKQQEEEKQKDKKALSDELTGLQKQTADVGRRMQEQQAPIR